MQADRLPYGGKKPALTVPTELINIRPLWQMRCAKGAHAGGQEAFRRIS
jgi:hypothetical protein